MRGHILLEGGAEFGGQMAAPDMRAIELAGGLDARVCIIPAAAAPDNNHQRAGRNGVRWFNHLGARQATLLPLIDHASASQSSIVASLRNSRLIYLLGGFPHYLGQTLAGSESWQAIIEAYHAGAVIGGSSAGAMVLCQHYYNLGTSSGGFTSRRCNYRNR
jgi:cyanophycinase